MIIQAGDIRKVRPVAKNINDLSHIEPYINDAEMLDVLPVIGASLYKQLDELDLRLLTNTGVNITNNQRESILIDNKLYTDLLNGCYYECDDCSCDSDKLKHSSGLINAIAYLAYSRLLISHSVNVTAFSVVFKTSEFSERVDEETLIREVNHTKKIGLEYLRQTVDYMKCMNMICDRKKMRRRNKFKAIGK